MNNSDLPLKKQIEQKIDYVKLFKIFWSRWYWIAGCIILGLILAYLYLWYTPQVYSTSSSMKFEERKTEFSELLSGSTPTYSRVNKLQSESYVIQSREVLLNAIARLDYRVSYFLKGRIRTTEVYPEIPFPIEIIKQDSSSFFRAMFDIEKLGAQNYTLAYKVGENLIKKTYRFGDTVLAPGLIFRVKSSSVPARSEYSFKFNTREDFLGRVSFGLTLQEVGKNANILQLSLRDKNPIFAQDMLNAIMEEYVHYDVRSRGTSASQTIEFIDKQLHFLYDKVQQSGNELQQYKQQKGIVNLSTSTDITLNRLTNFETQKNALKVEEVAINQLEQQVLNNKDQVDLNFNLEGSVGGLLSDLVTQWNSLLQQKEKQINQQLLSPTHPIVQETDKQIVAAKKAIINNIRLYRERNQKTQRYIESQITSSERDLNNLPSAERDFAKLQSKFDINQKVFTYLSEKKLEAEISRAAVVPGASIVDKATQTVVIAPVPGKIYSNAFLFGLVVGLGLILIVRTFNPYIYDKETVESLTSTPIIGVIRRFPGFIDEDNTQALSLQQPKSVFAESVRSVRTNLSFLAGGKDSKVICITSEIAGEGKSFVSVNLASTMALIEKRVVLIGADLRRSKLHKTFKKDNSRGLSSYLSKQVNLENIIHKTELEHLDFIPSGPVPPNPSELLHSTQMLDLLKELNKIYDYVVLDTAPVGLVSDSIPLIRNADVNLFVIRSGASKYSAASIPDRLINEYNLNNMVIVLNAFSEDSLHSRYYSSNYASSYGQYYYSDYSGYGSYNGYGYYLGEEKNKWWKFWKK